MKNQSCGKLRPALSGAIPLALVLTFLLSSAAVAHAQQPPVDSLKRLVLLNGDHVKIVDKSGKTTKGKVDGTTETSILLRVDNKRQEFPESQIQEIGLKRPKPKVRRALIGLAIGVASGVGVAMATFPADSEEYDAAKIGFGILFGLGGIGVAELIPSNKHDTVFRAPATAAGLRVNLSPLLSSKRKGASLSFAF